MTSSRDTKHQPTAEFLGVWEDVWQGRADRARIAERYRLWLRTQCASRDEAAERAVRVLVGRPQDSLVSPG